MVKERDDWIFYILVGLLLGGMALTMLFGPTQSIHSYGGPASAGRGRCSRVLLIGSDMPDLARSTIDEAFDLEHFDAVIGPFLDGGYYLIGF